MERAHTTSLEAVREIVESHHEDASSGYSLRRKNSNRHAPVSIEWRFGGHVFIFAHGGAASVSQN
eukprot:12511992-Ditylum_brightwellii.AAC.1